ncbi:hypothetical protein JXR93_13025 [bacterium]|nr:hypothetical protein [bacterium]
MVDAIETLYGTDDESSKENNYKVITISLYKEDLELLDEYVSELKKNGHKRMNKSRVIRYALRSLDITQIPKDQ